MRQPYGSSGNFLCGGFNNLDYLWVIRLTNAFYQINTLSISCYVMSQKGVCYFSRKMIVILHKILFNGSISDHKKYFLWLFFPEFNMCCRLLRQARSCVWYTASFMTKCAYYTPDPKMADGRYYAFTMKSKNFKLKKRTYRISCCSYLLNQNRF